MAKALIYHLLGVGKMPRHAKGMVEAEGIVLSDEGVRGTLTYKGYRAPWKRYWWRKVGFAGSVVLTNRRFVGYAFSQPVVDLSLEDVRWAKLDVAVERGHVLRISFEASDFHKDRSGRIECRWSTPQAQSFEWRLREQRSRG